MDEQTRAWLNDKASGPGTGTIPIAFRLAAIIGLNLCRLADLAEAESVTDSKG